jgi:predicted dehydrogenase
VGLWAAELRLGMIGLDTSHAIEFTRLLNQPDHKDHVPGGRVVAAVKAGSPDLEASWSRVEGYSRQLQDQFKVRLVPSIQELCQQVDAVLLESVDGRPHLAQARPVIQAGKPLFIDKPLAGSLRDAIEILRLAREAKVPVFSSSAYRFYDSLRELKAKPVGQVRCVVSWGPAYRESHHPSLFWYGIHPTEALFAVLGSGCESVVCSPGAEADVVTGRWSDGRLGTLVALRSGATPHKVVVFGSKAVAEQQPGGDSYAPLVREIMRFFQTGVAPVSSQETLEIFAFMEAADESLRQGGRPVQLAELLRRHGY